MMKKMITLALMLRLLLCKGRRCNEHTDIRNQKVQRYKDAKSVFIIPSSMQNRKMEDGDMKR